ncbi:hypothetical protein [Bifidobacterium margollesii]|nr:hypothetical protein [Bifidobacterium margollesii]
MASRRMVIVTVVTVAIIVVLAIGMGFAFAATRGDRGTASGQATSAQASSAQASSATSQSRSGEADGQSAGRRTSQSATKSAGTAAGLSGADLLTHADQGCDPHVDFTGSTATESLIGESGGRSLTLMSGKDSDRHVYQCVIRETRMPDEVRQRVEASGMNDGLQSASWDGVTMTWSVNGNVGVQLMFTAGR